MQKRADMVTATINGAVVSWVNNYFGPGTQDPPPAAPILPTSPPAVHSTRLHPHAARPPAGSPAVSQHPYPSASANPQPTITSHAHTEEKRPSETDFSQALSMFEENPLADEDAEAEEAPRPPRASSGSSGSSWDRIAYYDSESQAVENMMFMGNYGGQGSGVFD